MVSWVVRRLAAVMGGVSVHFRLGWSVEGGGHPAKRVTLGNPGVASRGVTFGNPGATAKGFEKMPRRQTHSLLAGASKNGYGGGLAFNCEEQKFGRKPRPVTPPEEAVQTEWDLARCGWRLSCVAECPRSLQADKLRLMPNGLPKLAPKGEGGGRRGQGVDWVPNGGEAKAARRPRPGPEEGQLTSSRVQWRVLTGIVDGQQRNFSAELPRLVVNKWLRPRLIGSLQGPRVLSVGK